LVEQLEQSEELPHGLLHAIMRQESGFDPQARSHAGARGLMQLMPRTASKTAERLGVTVSQETIATPWLNLSLGAHYLSMLLRVFEQNVPLAVAAYNAGPIAVGSWLRRAGDLPLDLWVAQIPYRETRHYVWRVMGNFARYRYIARGDQGVPSVDLALPTGVTIPADAY
jgi:soluble lytic murein transglycosylase